METSGFFDSLELEDGSFDRAYIAEQFANFFSLFIGNGVFGSPENQLKVVAKDGLTVTMKKGFAFINGYWYYNDADRDFTLTPNQTATSRVDSIVLRLDLSERKIESLYLLDQDGTTRGDNYYELQLASIVLKTGAVEVIDADITDKRTDESVCGLVTGILEVIETNDLFLQFESQFNFWFERMKGQLSEDAAGNLQQQLDAIKISLADVVIPVLKDDWMVLNEEEGIYYQEIVVQGLVEQSSPMLMLSSPNDITTDDEWEAFFCISDSKAEENLLTLYATDLPSMSFVISAKGVATSEYNQTADITKLVAKVNELDNEVEKLNSDMPYYGTISTSVDGASVTYGKYTVINNILIATARIELSKTFAANAKVAQLDNYPFKKVSYVAYNNFTFKITADGAIVSEASEWKAGVYTMQGVGTMR